MLEQQSSQLSLQAEQLSGVWIGVEILQHTPEASAAQQGCPCCRADAWVQQWENLKLPIQKAESG